MMSVNNLREDRVIEVEIAGHSFTFQSTWGLFSPRSIDEGSLLLLDHLQIRPDITAVDIGCGYGVLGLSIAKAAPQGQVHLIDKDFVAVDYAQINAQRNGLTNTGIYLSNGFSHVDPALSIDLVVSNLPAKAGNEFFQILFEDARLRMQPGSQIVVVTVNGLRNLIKRMFVQTFGNYKKLKQSRNYTVSSAVLSD